MGVALLVDTSPRGSITQNSLNKLFPNEGDTIPYSGHPNTAQSSLEHYLINIDKQKVSQVVRNLLSNALKFTPKDGRVTVHARIVLVAPTSNEENAFYQSRGLEPSQECSLSPPYFRFEVTDTGPGISKVKCVPLMTLSMLGPHSSLLQIRVEAVMLKNSLSNIYSFIAMNVLVFEQV